MGNLVKFVHDERKFDFRKIGLAIKRAREAKGMTQEELAFIIQRTPRTVMYNENNGQHPSLNTFFQMVTILEISVDQFFFPEKYPKNSCRQHIDVMLNSLGERELRIVEATIQALKDVEEIEDA